MLKSIAALTLCALSISALAMSNDEFVAQVKAQEKQIKADANYEKEAIAYCRALGPKRGQDEPKCVAQQNVATAKIYSGLSTARVK